jgi:hypothetical protein
MNEHLKRLAWEVNDLLNEYLVIDAELNKRSTGFFSVFRQIPFGEYKNKLQSIIERLELKRMEIYHQTNGKNLENIQKEFSGTLTDYTSALLKSIELLNSMVCDLYEKSKGSAGNKVSFSQHHKNTQAYNDSMQNYLQYGQKLNDLFDRL